MIIVKDIVMQKEEYEDANDYMHYDIYTREFYERFGETISVKKREYDEIEIGDEIYIEVGKVKNRIIKNNSQELLNNNILTVHEYSILEGYEPKDKELLTKEKIKEKTIKVNIRAKNAVIVGILIMAILIYIFLFKIMYYSRVNQIIYIPVTILFIALTLIFIKKSIYKIKNNYIKYLESNDFYIEEVKIIDVNKNIWTNGINERSFVKENTGEKIKLNSLRYCNYKDGDILYMIYLNNKNNTLLYYCDKEKYELDDELKQFIKEAQNERN